DRGTNRPWLTNWIRIQDDVTRRLARTRSASWRQRTQLFSADARSRERVCAHTRTLELRCADTWESRIARRTWHRRAWTIWPRGPRFSRARLLRSWHRRLYRLRRLCWRRRLDRVDGRS